jgi:hypothetical protein
MNKAGYHKTGYSIGKFKKTLSVLSAYTYDPVTDRYIYTNSVDGFSINYPIIHAKDMRV